MLRWLDAYVIMYYIVTLLTIKPELWYEVLLKTHHKVTLKESKHND